VDGFAETFLDCFALMPDLRSGRVALALLDVDRSAVVIQRTVGLAGIEPATSALSGPITRSPWNQMNADSEVNADYAHPETAWNGSARAISARWRSVPDTVRPDFPG
jgi:hypothetical protein